MQYSVRNRRRLRPTGEHVVPRTIAAAAVPVPVDVRSEGSGLLRALDAPVREITRSSVIKQNWQR